MQHFILVLSALTMTLALDERHSAADDLRFPLSVGQVIVPSDFVDVKEGLNVMVHFHGDVGVVQRNVARWKKNVIIIHVTLNGLSSVYREKFSDPNVFNRMLDEAVEALRQKNVVDTTRIASLTVTSFSAGFGAVRELLKSEELFRRIDALAMADSIYSGFIRENEEAKGAIQRSVDPRHMQGFLRFARAAAEGKKAMVVSYCQLMPETYASTSETAKFLMDNLGTSLERTFVSKEWASGWQCIERFDRNRLHVLSFAGDQGKDHMQHLVNLQLVLEALDLRK